MIKRKRKKIKKIDLKKIGGIGLPILLIGGYITREVQSRKLIKKTLKVLEDRVEMNEVVLKIAVDMGDLLENQNREDIYDCDIEDID